MSVYCFESRRKKIISYLHGVDEAEVAELVALTNASEATVRRDLLELEKEGRLMRTFGGARIIAEPSLVIRTFEQRSQEMRQGKQSIAQAAAKLVEPGMSIVIDSGSSCWNLASMLAAKAPLQVITSALAVIEALGEIPDIDVIVSGGRFRLENLDFVGPLVDFSPFHADIAFLGCDSVIPGKGVFSLDMQSAAISKSMSECSDRTVVLCDHTKIGRRACHQVLPSAQIDMLYVDDEIDEKQLALLNADTFETVICKTHAD